MADDKTTLLLELLLEESSKHSLIEGIGDIEKAIKELDARAEKLNQSSAASSSKAAKASVEAEKQRIEFLKKSLQLELELRQAQESISKEKHVFEVGQGDALPNPVELESAYMVMEESEKRIADLRVEAGKVAEAQARATVAAQEEAEKKRQKLLGDSIGLAKRLGMEGEETYKKLKDVPDAELKKLNSELQKVLQTQEKFNKAAQSMSSLSAKAFQLARGASYVAGATLGGLYYAINREANRQKDTMGAGMSAEAREWLAAQEKIQASYQRVAAVAMRELLPFMEKAADLAQKAAAFIEKHPEVIKGIAAVGAVAAIVGTISTAVGAILKFGSWVAQFGEWVQKFIAAGKVAGVAPPTGTGGVSGTLGTVALYASTVLLAAGAAMAIGNAFIEIMDKMGVERFSGKTKVTGGDVITGAAMLATTPANMLLELLTKLPGKFGENASAIQDWEAKFFHAMAEVTGSDMILAAMEKLDPSLKKVSQSAEQLNGSIIGTANAMQAASAYGEYQQANTQTNARYAQEKAKIESNYTMQVQALYRQHASAMSSIGTQLANTLAQIETSYQNQIASIEANFASQRASIIEQGNAQIIQIEQQAKEELARLEREHADRVEELTNDRDALGLAQENRDFERQKEELRRQTEEQLAAARRNTELQLQELERQHALQLQEAQRSYEEQKAQAQAQAAQEAAAEAANFANQMIALQTQKDEELKQLEEAHKNELAQNRAALIQKLHDLGYFSQQELETARAYQNQMLNDVNAFWQNYTSAMNNGLQNMPTTSDVPAYDNGGYIGTGLFRVGKNQREYVMNQRTTEAAERLVGGRLSSQSILSAMTGGMGQTVVVQLANGMTLMEAKRILDRNNRTIEKDLAGALKAIR